MKRTLLFLSIFMMSFLMMTCKPDPIGGEDDNNTNNDTTPEEPIVRKYLTKQLMNDDPEKIMLSIDWNDDCTQIKNVKYSMGYGSIANYEFIYYNNDSIRVNISILDDIPSWSLYYDVMMIHLNQNLDIDKIYCYANNRLQDIEKYFYDANGRLIERSYWKDMHKDEFVWDGDNVTKAVINGREYSYKFTDYIHPQYMIPFYISDQIFETGGRPFLTPLWENMLEDNCNYEVDGDNYITKRIYKDNVNDTVKLFHSFYYTTPK